jgi:hypothetical protein
MGTEETQKRIEEEIAWAKEAASKPRGRGRPRLAKKVPPSERQKKYVARLRLIYAVTVAERDGVDVVDVIRELYPILTGTLGSEAPV